MRLYQNVIILRKKIIDLPFLFNQPRVTKKPYKYKNNSVYEGQWKGGFRDGKGKMEWPDGATYTGDWILGYAHGKGTFIDVVGNIYEGEFYMNMAHR